MTNVCVVIETVKLTFIHFVGEVEFVRTPIGKAMTFLIVNTRFVKQN